MKSHFQNKAFSFLILVSLFVPIFSNAGIIVPSATLTIIINTQVEDALFNINIEGNYNGWQPEEQIQAQTQNLTFTQTTSIVSFYNHKVTQTMPVGWKLQGIICSSNDSANTFLYQPNGVTITSKAWTNITCIFNNAKVPSKTPVLIVPGIMGTEMFKDTEKLWADLDRMSYTIGDGFMDPLSFNQNLSASDNTVFKNDVIKKLEMAIGLVKFDYANGLINEFIGQGYVENETLFTFPYDWRFGVSGKYVDGKINSDLLKEKINQILVETGADKIDVIAHSMGGLITKKYVIDNQTTHKINKAVFVGVPNTGAPEAVKTLIQGDNMGIPFLNDAEVKKISQNMPGAYDLLPSQKYYDVVGSFAKVLNVPDIYDPNWNPGTPTLPENVLDYQEFGDYITQDKYLNSTAFNNSTTLHTQTFDDFDLRTAGVDLYRIVGCKAGTIANIKETRFVDTQGNINGFNYAIYNFDIGDGTVPITSATNLPVDEDKKYYSLNSEHGKMLSQQGTRQQITNIISGSTLNTGKNFWGNDLITQDITKCELNGKAIEVFSPIDLIITDQFGNKIGLAEDKSVINEIPNSAFEIMGEHKFIYLPTDNGQTYTINMQGTGTGTYTINVKDIQNTTETKTESFMNLPVTSSLTGTVNLGNSTTQTTLTVKQIPSSQAKIIYPTPDLPTNKEQCKNNGWKNFGNKFKNQGACVSFIQNGKLK